MLPLGSKPVLDPPNSRRTTIRSARCTASAALLVVAACGVSGGGGHAEESSRGSREPSAAPVSSQFRDFAIVNEYPHDARAYTQGFFFHDGVLYEGTGRYGESSLRRVGLENGEVQGRVDLPRNYFGEGIALLDGRIYQLTWRSRRGFVYRAADLAPEREFGYETEGWGLTTDGQHLIMSDGTASLYFLDPRSFEVVRTLSVHDDYGPVQMLNELEFVEGAVLANVWQREVILEISPETGAVTAEFDFSGLVAYEGAGGPDAVLNGIAYDPMTKRLFVTGKLWSRVYEVELLRPREP
jgi:glutamine cyclotransferase